MVGSPLRLGRGSKRKFWGRVRVVSEELGNAGCPETCEAGEQGCRRIPTAALYWVLAMIGRRRRTLAEVNGRHAHF